MRKWLLACALLGMLAGCTSTDTQKGAVVEDRTPPADTGTTVTPLKNDQVNGTSLDGSGSSLPTSAALLSIYFDYDSNAISDQYKPVVQANAQYLAAHPSAHLVIQGNTDKRGSPEYNLALGQRRADAVKQAMLLVGAREGQIETVSFGEEKPKAAGDDDVAYAQNRRADIVYKAQ